MSVSCSTVNSRAAISGASPPVTASVPSTAADTCFIAVSTCTAAAAVTCTAGGGGGTYTYGWSYVSGVSFTIVNGATATATIQSTSGDDSPDGVTGVYECFVEDALDSGNNATSNTVTVTLKHFV